MHRIISIAAIVVCILCLAVAAAETDTEGSGDILFSHRLHVGENELECTVCHEGVVTSDNTADRNLPEMELCGDCHDVEDDEECATCHRSPDDPSAANHFKAAFKFSHIVHVDAGVQCDNCHSDLDAIGMAAQSVKDNKNLCYSCHRSEQDTERCSLCHMTYATGRDYHKPDWRQTHGIDAARDEDWCLTCHQKENDCIQCHRGDNISGAIHELNYRFTHGLDAAIKTLDCASCHEREQFCNDCHLAELRVPLNHSFAVWQTAHGQAARRDPENCASCHENDNATCIRCHSDTDGIRGTDQRFHAGGTAFFSSHGPWHSDDGFMCYQCHTNTGSPGLGFCGYCHN